MTIQTIVCGMLLTAAGWSFAGLIMSARPKTPADTTNRILMTLTVSVSLGLFALISR